MKSLLFKLFPVIVISCLGIIIYSNSFHCSFHFDDASSITNNFVIRNIDHLQDIWDFWPCRFITYLSLAINYQFNEFDVFGYHLFNVIIHLISAILVWWLTLLTFSTPAMKEGRVGKKTFIKEFPEGEAIFIWLMQKGYLEEVSGSEGRPKTMSKAEKVYIEKKFPNESVKILTILKQAQENQVAPHADLIALFAGLIFVSHPIQTQAITYIVQRAASMATLFYLASLCFYVRSRLPQVHHSNLGIGKFYYTCSLITATVAMFTKEIAITLPLTMILYEFCFFKISRSIQWKPLVPFMFILLIIPSTMLLTRSVNLQEMHRVTEETSGITPRHYLLTQSRVIITYIRLLFLPLNQNVDYDYPVSKSLFELPTLLSFLLLILIFFSSIRSYSKYRLFSFSIFWFFLTLLPESSLFPIKDVIFEHRLYLPLVGYSLFLVSGVYYLFGKNTIKMMFITLTVIILCNSILTYQRNKVWKDELTLWKDTVGKSPHKARPYSHLGTAYNDQGNMTLAISEYNKSLELDPNDVQTINDRGNVYAKQGNYAKAIVDFTKAIEMSPNFAEPYYDRGLVLSIQGNFTQAIADYSKAIELNPHFADAYNNRAVSYFQLKDYKNAWDNLHKAEELGYAVNPGFISALKQASNQ